MRTRSPLAVLSPAAARCSSRATGRRGYRRAQPGSAPRAAPQKRETVSGRNRCELRARVDAAPERIGIVVRRLHRLLEPVRQRADAEDRLVLVAAELVRGHDLPAAEVDGMDGVRLLAADEPDVGADLRQAAREPRLAG